MIQQLKGYTETIQLTCNRNCSQKKESFRDQYNACTNMTRKTMQNKQKQEQKELVQDNYLYYVCLKLKAYKVSKSILLFL